MTQNDKDKTIAKLVDILYLQSQKEQKNNRKHKNNSQTFLKAPKKSKTKKINKHKEEFITKKVDLLSKNKKSQYKRKGLKNVSGEKLKNKGKSKNYLKNRIEYIRIDGGYSMLSQNIFSNGTHEKKANGISIIDVGYGHRLNPFFSIDATAFYRGKYKYEFDGTDIGKFIEHQKISSVGLMLSGYFMPKWFTRVVPYLVIGGGVAINETNDLIVENVGELSGEQQKSLAWQVGFGLFYKITNNINIDIMYRYANLGRVTTGKFFRTGQIDTGHFEEQETNKGTLRVNEFLIGINYNF
ncbi:MAG: porin family protein [Rickettsiales bacterium]|nr:porin family protein [Rickettsiales bacterium]